MTHNSFTTNDVMDGESPLSCQQTNKKDRNLKATGSGRQIDDWLVSGGKSGWDKYAVRVSIYNRITCQLKGF